MEEGVFPTIRRCKGLQEALQKRCKRFSQRPQKM
jgi:hypothetical protein